jgi:ADP-ribose pyrophosphatase YjhB (NUDIX family)
VYDVTIRADPDIYYGGVPRKEEMNAPDLSRPQLAVDLVLFTVLNEKDLSDSWIGELVSPSSVTETTEPGLSLFVVTMQGDKARKLPGGFVEGHERIAEAGQRIMREVLGLYAPVRLREVGTFDSPDRDSYSRVISIPSWGFVRFQDLLKVLGGRDQVGLELVNSNDVIRDFVEENGGLSEFDGVSRFGYRKKPTTKQGHVKQLPSEFGMRLLEQDHDEIIFYAWRKLRHAFSGRLDPFRYLGVKALGDEFRLSDLQEFQDVVCGISTHRDQFRRQMLSNDSFIIETDKQDSSRQGKPATLYTLGAELENTNE